MSFICIENLGQVSLVSAVPLGGNLSCCVHNCNKDLVVPRVGPGETPSDM